MLRRPDHRDFSFLISGRHRERRRQAREDPAAYLDDRANLQRLPPTTRTSPGWTSIWIASGQNIIQAVSKARPSGATRDEHERESASPAAAASAGSAGVRPIRSAWGDLVKPSHCCRHEQRVKGRISPRRSNRQR